MTVADWPYSWFPLLAGVGGFSGFSAAAGDAAGSLALAIFTFLMTFGVGGLMVYHFGLISSGRTTYEDVRSPCPIPSPPELPPPLIWCPSTPTHRSRAETWTPRVDSGMDCDGCGARELPPGCAWWLCGCFARVRVLCAFVCECFCMCRCMLLRVCACVRTNFCIACVFTYVPVCL